MKSAFICPSGQETAGRAREKATFFDDPRNLNRERWLYLDKGTFASAARSVRPAGAAAMTTCRAAVLAPKREKNVVKPTLLIAFAIVSALASPFSARASLGGNGDSVQADRVFLRGALKTTAKQNYSLQRIQSPNGVVVREYVSPAGNVFGISWQGPTRPDLRQILGPYFAEFTKAVPSKMRFRLVRGPFRIQVNGLVVEMGGHMRWYVGRAYLQQMIPAGVSREAIR
jgi:hypothetical protein